MNTSPQFPTLAACRAELVRQGLTLNAFQTDTGRRYYVYNFRGGLCFEGSLQQLKAELAAGWYRNC